MLARRLGSERVAAEPAAATELAGLCARLPLALGIAAARAAACPGLPLAALAAGLRASRARLDGLDTGDAATDVRTVFSWSCRQLTGSAGRMFRLLGVHPGPDITVPAAGSLAGVPPGEARQARQCPCTRMLTQLIVTRLSWGGLPRGQQPRPAQPVTTPVRRCMSSFCFMRAP
jgi:hypothetical protein